MKKKAKVNAAKSSNGFQITFKNQSQKDAWECLEKYDVLFLLGAPGTGKTHLACAYAISQILAKNKRKIIMTRPIVEAGENLGFLPGSVLEKCGPYYTPMHDCIASCVGNSIAQQEIIQKAIEIAPIAYCRGRTFNNSICIFDEAQNATKAQLKLFLTRFGENSKIIITGDPTQSDLPIKMQSLMSVVKKLEEIPEIGVVKFDVSAIVRHHLISKILNKFDEI